MPRATAAAAAGGGADGGVGEKDSVASKKGKKGKKGAKEKKDAKAAKGDDKAKEDAAQASKEAAAAAASAGADLGRPHTARPAGGAPSRVPPVLRYHHQNQYGALGARGAREPLAAARGRSAKVSKRRGHRYEVLRDEKSPDASLNERRVAFTGVCVVTFESTVEWASVRYRSTGGTCARRAGSTARTAARGDAPLVQRAGVGRAPSAALQLRAACVSRGSMSDEIFVSFTFVPDVPALEAAQRCSWRASDKIRWGSSRSIVAVAPARATTTPTPTRAPDRAARDVAPARGAHEQRRRRAPAARRAGRPRRARAGRRRRDGRALHTAVKEEHGPRLRCSDTQMLLRAGADAGPRPPRRRDVAQPLDLAAAAGFEQACLALLQYKADVNARQKDDRRPLHLAVARGHESVCVCALLRVEGHRHRGLPTPSRIAPCVHKARARL